MSDSGLNDSCEPILSVQYSLKSHVLAIKIRLGQEISELNFPKTRWTPLPLSNVILKYAYTIECVFMAKTMTTTETNLLGTIKK